MAVATKVYDFPLAKVEDQLVSFLKKRQGESTIADMIAGTGLPKYQVEQAARAALDEYAGRLKVTESGELLYYFPGGMRSTVRGTGPALRRFWKSFSRTSVRVLSFLFKIWIVGMLVGYFLLFVAIGVAAIVFSIAASAASRGDNRGGGGRDRGGGFGGMYLVLRLFDFLIRMWFWSSLLSNTGAGFGRRPARPAGRPFYKAVFGFVFGEGDPNKGWEEEERRHIISYIRSHKGVLTLEELMALTGREPDPANALVNRLLLEYEGEPGVTDDGTVVYSFPALMRTSAEESRAAEAGDAAHGGPSRRIISFSENKPRTNGWIIFFNAFNLLFGGYFLGISLTQGPSIVTQVSRALEQGSAAVAKAGPMLYSFVTGLLLQAGISPVPVIEIALGFIPVAFSIVFFIVPLLRKARLARRNDALREEALRQRIMAQVLQSPAHVDAREVRPTGTSLDPRDLAARSRRILERLAAALKAEPIPVEKGQFAYRFTELEREVADVESFRRGIDVRRFEVGKTVFDSGS